jgi:hypothetical protein
MPDGMGGIDPTQLEITGTLMPRGVWRVVGDWPSISILQLGGGWTSFGMAFDTRVSDGNPSMWPPSESSPCSLPFCLSFYRTAARTLLIRNRGQVGRIATRSDSTGRVKHLHSTVIEQGVQQFENKETDLCPLHASPVFGKTLSISEDALSVSRCYI